MRQSSVYGSAIPALTAGYSGFTNGDNAASLTTSPTCTSTAVAGSSRGSYPITCSGAVDLNYAITYAPGTLTIGQAPLTISFATPAPAPGDAGTSYEPGVDTEPNAPVSLSVAASSGAVCTVSDGTVDFQHAGVCVVVAVAGANSDYVLSRAEQSIDVVDPAGGGLAAMADGTGYWVLGSGGSVTPYGTASPYGSLAGRTLNQPPVAIVAAPNGGGY